MIITQPMLLGDVIDDVSNINLGQIVWPESVSINNKDMITGSGKLHWEIMELYNDVTRKVGSEEGVLVIDLAKKMPKSSRYYITTDIIHVNNKGAEKFAEIIQNDLEPFLCNRFEVFRKK